MKPGVTVTIDNTDKLKKALMNLDRNEVLVGVLAKNAARQPKPGETTDINNAAIGYIMEMGDPEHNLPARPFLGPGIEGAKDKLATRLAAAGRAAVDGDVAKMHTLLDQTGQEAASSVQRKITDGPFAPLAESTLAQRRARGRTGEKPLIDTGALRRAISYVVRKRG